MKKLERKHYLKHYQGGFAMVLNADQQVTGQIEKVDMEDGSVQIQSGEKSQWYDGDHVTPSLKSFADFACNREDIATVLRNLKWNKNVDLSSISEDYRLHHKVNRIELLDIRKNYSIVISRDWNVSAFNFDSDAFVLPENIGQIIFLFCELGYDVTGIFSK